MTGKADKEQDDDPPLTREEEIAELREDLEYLTSQREKFVKPMTMDERATRAFDRLWSEGNFRWTMLIIIIGIAASFYWEPLFAPIPIVPMYVVICEFILSFIWQLLFGREGRRAYRDQRVAAIGEEIEEVKKNLFRLGVKGVDRE